MCGISVIIDQRDNQVQESDIKRMNDLVKHRGPDGEGYFFGPQFALGHRMLRITDFTAKGRQPMAYMQYTIIHNGEVYNFREIKELLEKEGYSFRTNSDTEVIAAAYDRWGAQCTERFTGMWSFVIYDNRSRILFFSRDRFGIKPLFYCQVGNKLVLGSEIKQLKAFPEFRPSINQATAFDFLYHGKIEGVKESFFEGVQFLPGGHNLIYNLQAHSFSIYQWYDINKGSQPVPANFRDASVEFNHLFTKSVRQHTESRLPIGACLSGGLDSTSIVGIAEKIKNPLITFSSCYTQHGFNEIEYINDAVMHYGFPNRKNYPNIHELVDNRLLKKIIYHQDQPILSGSFFSEFKVFENAAANNIRIILSGQGADEFLGGYGEFVLLHLRSLLKNMRFKRFTTALSEIAGNQQKPVEAMLKYFAVFGWGLPYFSRKLERKIQSVVSDCLSADWIKKSEEKNSRFDLSRYRSVSDMAKDALMSYSLPHQLLSEDRNSMLHSIESRLPFLDNRLVEFCLSLPDNYIIRKGATKAILRESLKNVLPVSIYNRHNKLGFPGPEESLFNHHYEFIQHEFREYCKHFPGMFSPRLLEFHTAFHQGKVQYDNILFRALSFGTWAREFGLMDGKTKHIKAVPGDVNYRFL